MSPFSFRTLSALGFLACAGGIAFALYLQYGRGLEPCPMCIFQRIAMIAAGLVFLVAMLHGPQARGRTVYAVLAALAAATGAGIAGRQVWLQSLPADQVPACGPSLDYLLHMLPVTKVITMVLKGDGSCAKIEGVWLGITLPGWTLITFIALFLFALATPILAYRQKRSF
jgi:disulfide bond formation protein DsbB